MAQPLPTKEKVMVAAEQLGRPVTSEQALLLAEYIAYLVKWNKKMNLVGPRKWDIIFNSLVIDSLFLADFLAGLNLDRQPLTLDLGAGAGLPGIPLRMLWNKGHYWLVEIREKRALFMRSVLGRLALSGTQVFHGKAEDALSRLSDSGHSATADLILSKAFMPWEQLLDFVAPMLHESGIVVILSNDPPPNETDLSSSWRLGDIATYPVGEKEHFFWALHKKS